MHWTGETGEPVKEEKKQETLDGSAAPAVIHEGRFIKDNDTYRFTASKIEAETDKAYCFVTKSEAERWVPKSVCRVTKTAEGYLVDVCSWVE